MLVRKLLAVILLTVFIYGCSHVPPGQIKKEGTPNQMKKDTGYNPACGKTKIK